MPPWCASWLSRPPLGTMLGSSFAMSDFATMPKHRTGVTAQTSPRDVLGHPRGLAFLFATEMWERFSYYGMRALLVLYMVKYLLQPDQAGTVVGYGAIKTALEVVSGPLSVQALASQIYGLYTGLVYFTPVFGGFLADRYLGQRRTVVIGAILMAAGHFMMAFEAVFFFALLTLILGNGAFKPNISTQVGGLYAPGDQRRDRAYSIFYVGVNLDVPPEALFLEFPDHAGETLSPEVFPRADGTTYV